MNVATVIIEATATKRAGIQMVEVMAIEMAVVMEVMLVSTHKVMVATDQIM